MSDQQRVEDEKAARIRVDHGNGTTSYPIAEKVGRGWQSGVHFYPDEMVTVLMAYIPAEFAGPDTIRAATEAANAKYQGDFDPELGEDGSRFDDWGGAESERRAFVAGAIFEAGRSPASEVESGSL